MLVAKATLVGDIEATILGFNEVMISRLKGGESIMAEGEDLGIDGKLVIMYGNTSRELKERLEDAHSISECDDKLNCDEIIERANAMKATADDLLKAAEALDNLTEDEAEYKREMVLGFLEAQDLKVCDRLQDAAEVLSRAGLSFAACVETLRKIHARFADESTSH